MSMDVLPAYLIKSFENSNMIAAVNAKRLSFHSAFIIRYAKRTVHEAKIILKVIII